jgi:hypothetical protein
MSTIQYLVLGMSHFASFTFARCEYCYSFCVQAFGMICLCIDPQMAPSECLTDTASHYHVLLIAGKQHVPKRKNVEAPLARRDLNENALTSK